MGITAQRLEKFGLIDEVVPEPLGGAHRDCDLMARTLATALSSALDELCDLPIQELLAKRSTRLMQYGQFEEN